jgi:hypothetical protein
MKAYLVAGEYEPVELDLPDDPIAAADAAVGILDEYHGNVCNYPRVYSEADYAKLVAEMDGGDEDEEGEVDEEGKVTA